MASVTIDLSQLQNDLRNFQEQIPFASAKALTGLAQRVKTKEAEAIGQVFDNPTPFTLNALYAKSATKTDLQSKVGFKDAGYYGGNQTHYLTSEIIGGERESTKLERYLRSKNYLHHNELLIPTSAVKLNNNGNMPLKQINDMLLGLQQGYNRRFEYNYFIPPAGSHLKRGVWRSTWSTGSIAPMVLFIKRTDYNERLRFYTLALETVESDFYQIAGDAVQLALDTLRN